jgi:hypothetical protein
MGSLTWDQTAFPDPEARIAALRENQGIGLMLIEHAYVSDKQRAYAQMAFRRYLARECQTCQATYLESFPYWGVGGMIDWSHRDGGVYWHNLKREPLIDAGVIGHWTDLGEPQMYNSWAWYVGIPGDRRPLHSHADVHNLYNFLWSQSIYRGYAYNHHTQRPFILSRSGAPGIQRYGASMWSADIGSNLSSLATHMNVQMHMSMSGIDYYGADIGGFHRDALDGNQDEMYTQWFANGMAFDIPARPHTENLCNCRETAPDRVGDLQSNLQNARQRYALVPYLYSLAHRAYLYGEPVFPPLVYYYQDDDNVREMGHQKLLGRDLLVAGVAAHGETERQVYLPAGEWVNYHTQQRFRSSGQWYGPFAEYPAGRFTLPMFARAGAILPQMYVDQETMNVLGQRRDGSRRDELVVGVYADEMPSRFTLYEDDGQTIAYRDGAVRTTVLSQVQAGDRVSVTIESAKGTYAGALASRDNVVKLATDGARLVSGATVNGVALPYYDRPAAFDAAPKGWYQAGNGLVVAKSGEMDVLLDKEFVFQLGGTYRWSSNVVSAGGGWPSAVELDGRQRPHVAYPCGRGVCYAVVSGTQWITGTIPSLSAGEVSLALDPAGRPRVSVGNGGLAYAHSDGTSWTVETIEQDDGSAQRMSSALVLDAAGQPHIAYYELGPTSTDLRHAYLDGGRWVTESVSRDAHLVGHGAGASSALVIDAAGTLHALYDSEGGDIVHARLDGSGWMTQAIAAGHSGSMAAGPDGRLHVSFISGYDLRYATLEDSQWAIQDIAPIAVIDGGTIPASSESPGTTAIQIDSLGMPRIVYHYGLGEDAPLFYAQANGSGWTTEAIGPPQIAGHGRLSLALDPSGYPGIAHTRAWPEDKIGYAYAERPHALLQPGIGASLAHTGSQSLRTVIQAAGGSVTQSVEIVLTERDYAPSPPDGHAFAGQGFQIEAYGSDGMHLPDHVFLQPLTITIEYAGQDPTSIGDESTLGLWHWSGSAWDSGGTTVIERDPDSRRLVVTISRGSRFALFGEVHHTYLPLVPWNGGG